MSKQYFINRKTIQMDSTISYQKGILGFNLNNLSFEQKQKLAKLQDYDLSFVAQRLNNKQLLPSHLIESAIIDFKRFIGLVVLGYSNLSVPSREVDEVWHNFILYTKEYHLFSNRFYGKYIHHCPSDSKFSTSKKSSRDTLNIYKKYFSELENETLTLMECSSDGSICQIECEGPNG